MTCKANFVRLDLVMIIGRRRQAVQFTMGSDSQINIIKKPKLSIPELSQNYRIFLNSKSHHPLLNTVIGNSYDRNSITIHDITRNHFQYFDPFLFEASNSRIRILKDPENLQQWNKNTSTISTRSKCTGFSINKQLSYGIATTLSKPAIFTLTQTSSELKFSRASYINYEVPIHDVKASDYIPGEAAAVSKDGHISLFDKDQIVSTMSIEGHESWDLSPVSFISSARVACAGFKDSLQIIDFRKKEPSSINIPTNYPSSIITLIAPFHIAVSTPDNITIIDTRFPAVPEDTFPFYFPSSASSMSLKKFGDFDVIFCQCCESGDVVAFPFNDTSAGCPCMPFQITVADYITHNPQTLTGMEIISNTVFLQYENGCVLSVDVDGTMPARRTYVPIVTRNDENLPKDTFDFKPQFEEIDFANNSQSQNDIHWKDAFPEMSRPPPNALYEIHDEQIPEGDAVIENYLIEIEDTLQFDDDDLDTAIPAVWKNHIDTVSRFLQQTDV